MSAFWSELGLVAVVGILSSLLLHLHPALQFIFTAQSITWVGSRAKEHQKHKDCCYPHPSQCHLDLIQHVYPPAPSPRRRRRRSGVDSWGRIERSCPFDNHIAFHSFQDNGQSSVKDTLHRTASLSESLGAHIRIKWPIRANTIPGMINTGRRGQNRSHSQLVPSTSQNMGIHKMSEYTMA